MRTETINIYTFEELSDKAKDNAISWWLSGGLDHEWWDSTYEYAKNVGLNILEFDLGRGCYCKAEFIESAEVTAQKILAEHGDTCDTHESMKSFMAHNDDGEFLRDLQEDYRIMLANEYDYLTSEENARESIIINEYEFTENGEIFS